MNLNDKNSNTILIAKQKLISAGRNGSIAALENEWAKFKYLILAKNPNGYKEIRKLLKDKAGYPVEEFYAIVEASLLLPENKGFEINAAQHVFGYFKNLASSEEKVVVIDLIAQYKSGRAPLPELKLSLYRLAAIYNVGYLLESYYFLPHNRN